jgi:hypothetical protein
MHQKFSLILSTQGNVDALKRTIDSLGDMIDEVVVGSCCVFKEDELTILSYNRPEVPIKIIKFPFNFIFCNGFANMLNSLSPYAKNDLLLYLNVGEIVYKGREEIHNVISPSYNCYYLTHPIEKHLWYRVWDRREVRWGGIIHEEIYGNLRPSSVPLFMFDDTPKDKENERYGKIMNDIKELVYWNQYVKLIDQPHLANGTNPGWTDFARDGFNSFIDRMHNKGKRYDAFLTGDLQMYLDDVNSNPEFQNTIT